MALTSLTDIPALLGKAENAGDARPNLHDFLVEHRAALYALLTGADASAASQTTWSFDPSNSTGLASDLNSGIDDSHPLLTYREWFRRVGITPIASQVWRVLSNTVETGLDFGNISQPIGAVGSVSIDVIGIPTVIGSGIVTAHTEAPWSVTDSAIPNSWAASGYVSSASGSRFIRKTDLSLHAYIHTDQGSKTATVGPVNTFAEAFTGSGNLSNFTNGDAYEVISIPTFPNILNSTRILQRHLFLDYGVTASLVNESFISPSRFCGFRNSSCIARGLIGLPQVTLQGCGFLGQAIFAGKVISSLCSYKLGAALTQSVGADWNGLPNEFRAQFLINHGVHGFRIGVPYLYNIAGVAIELNNGANALFDGLHGSGNGAALINVRDAGCLAITNGGTFDATTSAAHPLSAVGNSFDYADWNASGGAYVAARAAGFVT